MIRMVKLAICCSALVFSCACAYRYYLGMHGPSMNAFPDIHQNMTEDRECLACHHPDQAFEAPPTSHPGFTGCFKCHSDSL